MNINDTLQAISINDVVIGMDCNGNIKLIKNNFDEKQITDVHDCLNILFNLFNQKTQVEFFNEAFYNDFEKLIIKHSKRMKYECEII